MWPLPSVFCYGYQAHFCCNFREETTPHSQYPSTPDRQLQHGKSWLQRASCAPLRAQESEGQKPTVPLRLAEPRPGRRSEKPSGFMTVNPKAPQEHLHLCWCIHTEFVNSATTSLCCFCKVSFRITSGSGFALMWNLLWHHQWLLMPSSPLRTTGPLKAVSPPTSPDHHLRP